MKVVNEKNPFMFVSRANIPLHKQKGAFSWSWGTAFLLAHINKRYFFILPGKIIKAKVKNHLLYCVPNTTLDILHVLFP